MNIAIYAARVGWIVDARIDASRRRGACVRIARVINDQEITACSSINIIYAEASIDRVVAAIGGNRVVGPGGVGNGVCATAGAEVGEYLEVVNCGPVCKGDRRGRVHGIER